MVIKQYQHLSEEDTKNQIINPALNKAGWTPNMMLMEYSLKSDRFEIIPGANKTKKISASKRNFPDYLLCKYANMPIAVVETRSMVAKILRVSIKPRYMPNYWIFLLLTQALVKSLLSLINLQASKES